MLESLLGLRVVRAIPPEVITGLLAGQYKQYGGVIRWARGEKAGQIVRHLLPVTNQSLASPLFTPVSSTLGAVNTYQLHRLSGQVSNLTASVNQLFQVATGTMVLSGLNLAVSAVGFAVLNEKLKKLEGKLNEIQQEVKAIRSLLEIEERSKLGAALRDLLSIAEVKNANHRHTILFNAKNVFGPVSLKYKELLLNANTIETAIAYEEYFCLTALAHARCLAELEMLDMASRDMLETHTFWKEQSRRIANDLLLAENPERFLFSDFAEDLPVSILAEWLDFSYGEEKGYGWIDELRSKTRPWYAEDGYVEVGKGAAKVTSSLFNVASRYAGKVVETEIDRQRAKVLPAFQKLVARNNVLEGYVEQYKLLEVSNTTPTAFESQIRSIAESESVDGYLILEPSNEI
jgi:outer membrane murein-binding lipoprotein Lpp